MTTLSARAFKSGNSVAVRLPRALGVRPDERFEVERRGAELVLRKVVDVEAVRANMRRLCEDLMAIGPSPDGVQEREPLDWPDRPGL